MGSAGHDGDPMERLPKVFSCRTVDENGGLDMGQFKEIRSTCSLPDFSAALACDLVGGSG